MAQPDDGDKALDQSTYMAAHPSGPPLPTSPLMVSTTFCTRNYILLNHVRLISVLSQQSPWNTVPPWTSSATRNDQEFQDGNMAAHPSEPPLPTPPPLMVSTTCCKQYIVSRFNTNMSFFRSTHLSFGKEQINSINPLYNYLFLNHV